MDNRRKPDYRSGQYSYYFDDMICVGNYMVPVVRKLKYLKFSTAKSILLIESIDKPGKYESTDNRLHDAYEKWEAAEIERILIEQKD